MPTDDPFLAGLGQSPGDLQRHRADTPRSHHRGARPGPDPRQAPPTLNDKAQGNGPVNSDIYTVASLHARLVRHDPCTISARAPPTWSPSISSLQYAHRHEARYRRATSRPSAKQPSPNQQPTPRQRHTHRPPPGAPPEGPAPNPRHHSLQSVVSHPPKPALRARNPGIRSPAACGDPVVVPPVAPPEGHNLPHDQPGLVLDLALGLTHELTEREERLERPARPAGQPPGVQPPRLQSRRRIQVTIKETGYARPRAESRIPS